MFEDQSWNNEVEREFNKTEVSGENANNIKLTESNISSCKMERPRDQSRTSFKFAYPIVLVSLSVTKKLIEYFMLQGEW